MKVLLFILGVILVLGLIIPSEIVAYQPGILPRVDKFFKRDDDLGMPVPTEV